jgi:hypothetical protein
VRNPGVSFDSSSTFSSHVANIRRNAFFHLKGINSVRDYIPKSMLPTLIHAFVTSRIDFCNSVLFNLPAYTIKQLQTVQNACAKVITGAKKFDSASDQLVSLHWLPVQQRISFKLLIIGHKVAHDSAPVPSYLRDDIFVKENIRFTRSSLKTVLDSKRKPKLATVGYRSYHHGIPDLWNKLPDNLTSITQLSAFKANLKTHLFREAFKFLV